MNKIRIKNGTNISRRAENQREERRKMENLKINPDYPDITCEHGYYPYCPLCEHGYVVQEEWMQEDQCQWVCLLDEE